jgi:orotate phosphoribosyltransferase
MKSSLHSKLLKVIGKCPQVIIWGPAKHSQGYLVPYYFNFRGAVALPALRHAVVNILVAKIKKYKVDIIAGAETAGIAWAALVADRLNKPIVYIRKERKKFLNKRVVEGIFRSGASAVLIDDTMLLGATKRLMVNQSRRDGLQIKHILLLYNTGTSQYQKTQFKTWLNKYNIKIDQCFTRDELSDAFLKRRVLTPELIELAAIYRGNPYGWQKTVRAKELLPLLRRQAKKYNNI